MWYFLQFKSIYSHVFGSKVLHIEHVIEAKAFF